MRVKSCGIAGQRCLLEQGCAPVLKMRHAYGKVAHVGWRGCRPARFIGMKATHEKSPPQRMLQGACFLWSGKRDLNPQPSAWEADTLPLSYSRRGRKEYTVERETGFEPATSTLARLHSTTELLPHGRNRCIDSLSILVNKEIG